MEKRVQISTLIELIYDEGMSTDRDRNATTKLAKLGRPALEALIDAPERPTKQHPRDVAESFVAAYCEFAKIIPDVLVDSLEAGRIQPWIAYSALGYAKGERSRQVLLQGLQASHPIARGQAIEALIRRGEKDSVPSILGALGDRSDSVKSTVVFAMGKLARLRRPEAVPLLERIVNNKSMQRHSPGTIRAAKRVIELIQQKAGG